MLKYVIRYKSKSILSMILVTVMVVCTLLQPKILAKIMNDGINHTEPNSLIATPDTALIDRYGLILIGIAIIGLIAGIINTIIAANIAQRVGADMREDAFRKIQTFSYADIEAFETSNLVVRLTNDLTQVQNFVLMIFQSLFRIPLLFVGSFVLAVITLPQLWWIIIVEIVIIMIALMFLMKVTFPNFGKYQKGIDRINTVIKENFEGIRVVKSFVQEKQEIEKFTEKSDNLAKINFNIGRNFSILMPVIQMVGTLAIVAVIYFAKDLAIENIGVIGDITSFTIYLGQILMAVLIGGMIMMQAGRSSTSSKRVAEILDFVPSISYKETGIETIEGGIEFKDVSFTYPGEQLHALNNISFKVNKSETIGVVGATGSGKSTLVNLISRLFDSQSGQVLIDGVDIKDIPKNTLRKSIATVLQRPILFSGSISSNIRDGKLDASLDDISHSAKYAQASEFIEVLEGGYNSKVLQRGNNFSGGQKQRLSIARGLVKDPSILILDDSTSALDSKSERLVKEGLATSFNQCTKVIISQKISSVVDADQILVLDEGNLVAVGKHKDLVQTCDVYREIYESQKGKGE